MLDRQVVEALTKVPSKATAPTVRSLAYEWLEMWDMLARVQVVAAQREGAARGQRDALASFLGIKADEED